MRVWTTEIEESVFDAWTKTYVSLVEGSSVKKRIKSLIFNFSTLEVHIPYKQSTFRRNQSLDTMVNL